jgi:hypothetical protein
MLSRRQIRGSVASLENHDQFHGAEAGGGETFPLAGPTLGCFPSRQPVAVVGEIIKGFDENTPRGSTFYNTRSPGLVNTATTDEINPVTRLRHLEHHVLECGRRGHYLPQLLPLYLRW